MSSSEEADDPTMDSFADRLLQAGLLVDVVYTPILCVFGFLGNSLSLVVFYMDSKYRRQSASYYLSALAISDTGFLFNLFAVWWENMYGGIINSKIMCPLVMYLGQVACFISVYLTVAFSLERYIVIHYPLSRASLCTPSKAKKRIIGIVSLALALFSYAWIIAQVIEINPADFDSEYGQNGTNETYAYMSDETSWNQINQNGNDIFFEDETDTDLVNAVGVTSDPLDFFETGSIKLNYEQAGINREKREHGILLLENTEANDSRRNEKGLKKHGVYNSNQHISAFNNFLEKKESTLAKSNKLLVENESSNLERNYGTLISRKFSNGTSVKIFLGAGINPTAKTSMDEIRDYDTYDENHSVYICSVPKHYYKISEVANYLDMAITLAIPFILITFVNASIALAMWKIRDERVKIVAAPSPSTSAVAGKHLDAKQVKPLQTGQKAASSMVLLPRKKKETVRNGSAESTCSSNSNSIREIGALEERKSEKETNPVLGPDCISPGDNNELDQQMQPPKQILQQKISDTSSKSTLSNRVHKAIRRQKRQNSSEIRVTKLLLLVSTVFLVLNLPLHVIRCAQFMQSVTNSKEEQNILLFLQPWANLLFNTNFAVNFFLYCASGSHFRQSLKKITARLLQKWSHQRESTLSSTQAGYGNTKLKVIGDRCKLKGASGTRENTGEPSTSTFSCRTVFVKESEQQECVELQDMSSQV